MAGQLHSNLRVSGSPGGEWSGRAASLGVPGREGGWVWRSPRGPVLHLKPSDSLTKIFLEPGVFPSTPLGSALPGQKLVLPLPLFLAPLNNDTQYLGSPRATQGVPAKGECCHRGTHHTLQAIPVAMSSPQGTKPRLRARQDRMGHKRTLSTTGEDGTSSATIQGLPPTPIHAKHTTCISAFNLVRQESSPPLYRVRNSGLKEYGLRPETKSVLLPS